jgi:hypothetical protein
LEPKPPSIRCVEGVHKISKKFHLCNVTQTLIADWTKTPKRIKKNNSEFDWIKFNMSGQNSFKYVSSKFVGTVDAAKSSIKRFLAKIKKNTIFLLLLLFFVK